MFIFYPIYTSKSIIIDLEFIKFDICTKLSLIWNYIGYIYLISCILTYFLIGNSLFSSFSKKINLNKPQNNIPINLYLYIGKNAIGDKIYIEENGLYQNF